VVELQENNLINAYLFAAYTLFWLIFMFYAWNLSRRELRLEKELEALKKIVGGQSIPD
jgi:CcmD family protein